jgi:hypothetical protein
MYYHLRRKSGCLGGKLWQNRLLLQLMTDNRCIFVLVQKYIHTLSAYCMLALMGLYGMGMPLLHHTCLKSGKVETALFASGDLCMDAPRMADCCAVPEAAAPACCATAQSCSLPQAAPAASSCATAGHAHHTAEDDGSCNCCHTESTQILLTVDTPQAQTNGLHTLPVHLLQVFLGWEMPSLLHTQVVAGHAREVWYPPGGRQRLCQQLTILRI